MLLLCKSNKTYRKKYDLVVTKGFWSDMGQSRDVKKPKPSQF